MPDSNVLIYLMRRDLRLEDNPIFSSLSKSSGSPHTHLLPLYIFPAQQLQVSGFLQDGQRYPFPDARSQMGGFWRCGPHRARFLAESVWDLKQNLEKVDSGLEIRVGMVEDVISNMLGSFQTGEGKERLKVSAVWMTSEEGVEEKREERAVKNACSRAGVEFKLWQDEKYFIDDRDIPYQSPQQLPDVFTAYRKDVEPLREAPRQVLPTPAKSSLPPLPPRDSIPPQQAPFIIPDSFDELEKRLVTPVVKCGLNNPPEYPADTKSAHPFHGGSNSGHERIKHLITSGSMTTYKDTRNGLLGEDFSTKLSAWLSLGCITSRQVHQYLMNFEDGTADGPNAIPELGKGASGYGKGENNGTKAVRFELLWRDYMRLCTRKFGPKLFRISGFREESSYKWKAPSVRPMTASGVAKVVDGSHGYGIDNRSREEDDTGDVKRMLERFLDGTTGMGLIDASQRELYHTGYTSNRARQNVASFLAKHLGIDWRFGAEWYESMLVDYDLSSNWGNWQYVAGVGNDPRGEARVFNPVKQAYDYDSKGDYVKAWVPELRPVDDIGGIFQAWTLKEDKRREFGLAGIEWVERPLKRIDFVLGKRGGKNPYRGRGGSGGGGPSSGGSGSGFRGGSERTGGEKGRGRGAGYGRGYGGRGTGFGRGRGGFGREARTGYMEKMSAAQQGDFDVHEQT